MATASSLNLQQTSASELKTRDQTKGSSCWLVRLGYARVDGNDIRLFIWISILVTLHLLWGLLVCILKLSWFLVKEINYRILVKAFKRLQMRLYHNTVTNQTIHIASDISNNEEVHGGIMSAKVEITGNLESSEGVEQSTDEKDRIKTDVILQAVEGITNKNDSVELQNSTEVVVESEDENHEQEANLELVIESVNNVCVNGNAVELAKAAEDFDRLNFEANESRLEDILESTETEGPNKTDDSVVLENAVKFAVAAEVEGVHEGIQNISVEVGEWEWEDTSMSPSTQKSDQDQEAYCRTRTTSLSHRRRRDEKLNHSLPLAAPETHSGDNAAPQLRMGPGRLTKTLKCYRIKKVKSAYKPHGRTKKRRSVHEELKDLTDSVRDYENNESESEHSDEQSDEEVADAVQAVRSHQPVIPELEGIELINSRSENIEVTNELAVAIRKCAPRCSDRKRLQTSNDHQEIILNWYCYSFEFIQQESRLDFWKWFALETTLLELAEPVAKKKKECESSLLTDTQHLDACILGCYFYVSDSHMHIDYWSRQDFIGLIGRQLDKTPDWDCLNMIIGV